MSELIIRNQRIINFYKQNPQLNFEAINLIFVDLFSNILSDVNSVMNISVNNQILHSVSENTQKIDQLQNSVVSLNETVNSLQKSIINTLYLKFTEIKADYLQELRIIVDLNNHEKIAPLLEKNNNQLIDKTTYIINDVIPKNQIQYYHQVQESIKSFYKSISDDTRVLLKYVDNNSIKDYVNNFEMKSSIMFQNIQQPIYSFISASEERINNNLSLLNTTIQTKLLNEFNDFFQTYKTDFITSAKQILQINAVVSKIFPTAEIIQLNKNSLISRTTTPLIQQNDFKTYFLKRNNFQRIIVQNTDIDRNVSTEEIDVFQQLVEENNCDGVFLSQNAGFCDKPNFYIEIHNKNIIVYVHEVKYSKDKIKSAIDIIDILSSKIKDFNYDNQIEYAIEKDVLEEINKEYQVFISNKEAVTNTLKDSQKKMMHQLDEFKFPILEKYLCTKFSSNSQKQTLKCDICKLFNANNLKALAAHKRGCTRKNGVSNTVPLHNPTNSVISNTEL
jgi:hypothetical protein